MEITVFKTNKEVTGIVLFGQWVQYPGTCPRLHGRAVSEAHDQSRE